MNFLNKPGIQDSIDSTKLDIKNNKIISNNVDSDNIKEKTNKFYYLILVALFLFIAFSSYVYLYNYNYTNDINISYVIDDLDDYNNMFISSIVNTNNKINIVLSCHTEGVLFNNIYNMKNDYPNLKISSNSHSHKIWIQEKFKSKNISDLDFILLLIQDNNLNVEWEIINNNLIIIGTIKNIKNLFLSLEKKNLHNFNFELNFIKNKWNKLFYKLVI